ncbi:MAG: hypothetical protein JW910_18315 [Anaerolineae bacterium]|nr:hypothetical protein [Anaerolineae bacterium]
MSTPTKDSLSASERADLLHEAYEHIEEAVEQIKQATRDTDEWPRVRAYLVSTLEISLSDDHDWLASNTCTLRSLIDWAEELEQEEVWSLPMAQSEAALEAS